MTVAHRAEAAALRAGLWLLRRLGLHRAPAFCAALARGLGPWLPVSKIAHRNLRLAMPELDEAARRRIVRGVWDNLGRTVGELPFVGQLAETESGPGWQLEGREHVRRLVETGGPAIFVTAHFGNWELLPLAAERVGVGFASIYRPADNKRVNALILELRREAFGDGMKLFPKGSQGARQALAYLRAGGRLGLLQDQKMNDGIEARLFGHKAMTASASAALALRIRCPVIPGYTLRIGPARFRVVCEAPLPMPDTGDRDADQLALTQAINDRIEAWVRASPESWLWLHRRWPKALYADLR